MPFVRTVIPAPRPIGALTVGATAHGLALVAWGDDPERAEWAERRFALLGDDEDGDPTAMLERASTELAEYLADRRRVFEVPVDWSLTSGSRRTVLRALYDTVPFGDTVTYGELAVRGGLGKDHTAARGVGSIMGSNPVPVVVPCHRCLASDGLGGFGGGRATKEWLLALEGVIPATLDF